ncbi:CYTH domain-containing protein [Gemella cuniculi]|uniref:CYTH domain-containing protein n=1 Tax=Gemella cuniculi TaxID=150240 RepID=UPI00040A8FB3|nr:CYTH domain-containing protein [Gemella cuniculi]
MKEIEIEFKNLLTKEEYDKLFQTFELEKKEATINKNYYYDDANNSLKKANAALRIRHTNTKSEITLKIKGEKQNIEINIPINKTTYPSEPVVLPIIPEEILTELIRLKVAIKTPMLFQKIETLRYEIELKTGLLALDKTTFKNNIVDYELEFETNNYDDGLKEFKKLLAKFSIIPRTAKPKIARAVLYSNEEQDSKIGK